MYDAEGGLGKDERLGQPVQPAESRLESAGPAVLFDQANSSLDIGNGQRIGYCFAAQLSLLEPLTGPAVQLRNQDRLCLPQTGAQHLGKQVMVAIPLPFIVKGNQEQVAPLDLRQPRLAIVSAAHGIAQGATEPIQQTGL